MPTDVVESLWQAAEEHQDDPAYLLVLADALEDAGDPLAAGVRRLGVAGRKPFRTGSAMPDYPGRECFDWWLPGPCAHCLDDGVYDALRGGWAPENHAYHEYETWRGAMLAAAAAYCRVRDGVDAHPPSG